MLQVTPECGELVASILDIHKCTVSKRMLYMPNNTEDKAGLAPKRLSDELREKVDLGVTRLCVDEILL